MTATREVVGNVARRATEMMLVLGPESYRQDIVEDEGHRLVTSPMVHRLKLLDPDLFNMLHMTIGAQGGTVHGQADYIKSFDIERDGEHWNPLIHLMRQAYVTMGRLMTREDRATQYKMMGWGEPDLDDLVQDVSIELAQ